MQTEIRPNALQEEEALQASDTASLEEQLIDTQTFKPFVRSPLMRFATLAGSGLTVGILFSILTYSLVSKQETSFVIETDTPVKIEATSEIFNPETDEVIGSGEKTIHEDLIIDLGQGSTQNKIDEYMNDKKIKLEKRKFVHSAQPGSGKLYAPTYSQPKKFNVQSDSKDGTPLRLNPIPKSERFSDGETTMQWQSGFSVNNPEKNIRIGEAYKSYIEDEYGKPMIGELSSFEKGPGDLLDAMKSSNHGPK